MRKIIFNNKKDIEITWNLDCEMTKWINKYFKLYKEAAKKIVDLTYQKFVLYGEVYTQEEMIDMIIDTSDKLLKDYFEGIGDPDMANALKNTMMDAIKEVYWAMWW